MKVTDAERYINMLVGNISFHADYNAFVNNEKRLLIVEGQTDKTFIEKYVANDVTTIIANKAFGNRMDADNERINCKKAIIQTIYGLYRLPVVIKCPQNADKWLVYGLVDRDDGIPPEFENLERIFITDTRDLETLLLATDVRLVDRVSCGKVDYETYCLALNLSFRLSELRSVIHETWEELECGCVNAGSNEVDFSRFIVDNQIVIESLVDYIIDQSGITYSKPQKDKHIQKIMAHKRIRKMQDIEKMFKSENGSLDASFWRCVNGHDILAILRYLNAEMSSKYRNKGCHSLNRMFEMDLICEYDTQCFKNAVLYESLLNSSLVNS